MKNASLVCLGLLALVCRPAAAQGQKKEEPLWFDCEEMLSKGLHESDGNQGQFSIFRKSYNMFQQLMAGWAFSSGQVAIGGKTRQLYDHWLLRYQMIPCGPAGGLYCVIAYTKPKKSGSQDLNTELYIFSDKVPIDLSRTYEEIAQELYQSLLAQLATELVPRQ